MNQVYGKRRIDGFLIYCRAEDAHWQPGECAVGRNSERNPTKRARFVGALNLFRANPVCIIRLNMFSQDKKEDWMINSDDDNEELTEEQKNCDHEFTFAGVNRWKGVDIEYEYCPKCGLTRPV